MSSVTYLIYLCFSFHIRRTAIIISRIKIKGKIHEKALSTTLCTNVYSIYVKNNFQGKKVHRNYILKAMNFRKY